MATEGGATGYEDKPKEEEKKEEAKGEDPNVSGPGRVPDDARSAGSSPSRRDRDDRR